MKFVSYTSGSKYAIQPTFQRLINVIWTLWINIEITLIRRWIWNKIRGRRTLIICNGEPFLTSKEIKEVISLEVTISTKDSILDVWKGSEYVAA